MKQVRILVIGDEAVGKTSLIERYVKETFLMNHSPTVINEYVKYSKYHELHIRDCSALPEFKSLRFLQYAEVDIILFCFNLATIGTLDSLKSKWLPEVKEHCGNAIRILVGCKNDLDSISLLIL
ncbi:rho-related GTP-binding protein RhoE-like [Atheta coriaria]|uniref:rho-related GTP-binding protein RhoE-like n=1 Tax=Dalotia coriaria TaxID=877792 RepID=UPI0031F40655